MTVSVVLHAGTLAAIGVFYFRELFGLIRPSGWPLLARIAIGSIPAGIVGVTLKKTGVADKMFEMPVMAAIGLLLTAIILFWSEAKKGMTPSVTPGLDTVSWRQAFLVGCAQAVAILPGVSRSGSTIAAAIRVGIPRTEAATFSFLLAVPALGGATLLELLSGLKKGGVQIASSEIIGLAVGFAVSAIVGYLSLRFLITILKKGKLSWFAWYCGALGIIVLTFQLFR